MAALIPCNEAERLAALQSYAIMDTASEEAFDELVQLAAQLTDSPIAFASLIDAERQWIKARYGLDTTQIPRDDAFCAHAILNPDQPFIVEDAGADPRFSCNPYVVGEPYIRAYLGVPLVNAEGFALGSLCVIDRSARHFDQALITAMQTLARSVVTNLELRRTLIRDGRDAGNSERGPVSSDAGCASRASEILRVFDAEASTPAMPKGAQVYLQPILAMDRGAATASKIIALEALTRWSHPDTGTVPPAELFPLLGPERSSRLDYVIREQALAAFAALRSNGLGDARLALNLSAHELGRQDILPVIVEQASRAGIALDDLELEITEDVLFDRAGSGTIEQLIDLRARGALLVLDDFGTGTSGLAQLLRLPLDAVKLDKQFISGLEVDKRAREVVRASVMLAHRLGLRIVAEGVEHERQSTMLQAYGCDGVQGFLYARPMPPNQLAAWLEQRCTAVFA